MKTVKPKVKTIDTCRCATVATQRIRGWKLKKIIEWVGFRDEYTCRKCGRVTAEGEVDHIIPLHLGGTETDDNRQWLCKECHEKKSKAEEEGRGGSNLPK